MTTIDNTRDTSYQRPSLVVAWVDKNIGEQGMQRYIKERFETLSPSITQWLYFNSSEDFISYTETNKNIKLISVMSGGMSRLLVPQCSDIATLHSFYVFCVDIDGAQKAMEGRTKVKGIFNIEDDLYEQMADDLSKLLVEEGVQLTRLDERAAARLNFEEAKRLLNTEANKVSATEKQERIDEIHARIDQLFA